MGEYKLRYGAWGSRCVMGSEHDLCYYCMHAPQQKLELACYGEGDVGKHEARGCPDTETPLGGCVLCTFASRIVNTRACEIRKKGVLVIQRQRPFRRIRHGASCNKLQNSR